VRWENQRDNDTDRYELEAQSKQIAGAAERIARARSPSIKTAYPTAFSQTRAPVSDDRQPMPGPGQSPRKAVSCFEWRHSRCGLLLLRGVGAVRIAHSVVRAEAEPAFFEGPRRLMSRGYAAWLWDTGPLNAGDSRTVISIDALCIALATASV
jgi:hypothetical protein